ncbi:hypothetical protein [Amycolatopsis sacchari]|uniref:hypothetical protein n=1 Tax=Amycolatopsis sacchari TaxID=115433 RepID=UPI003EC14A6E
MPIVREALGLVSYHAGHWAEALSELRAVRRMTRTDTHIAVIADAERALGRPERALDLAREAAGSDLPREVEVELRIVAAGARRDMGQLDAAVVSLQGPDLDAKKRDPWSARLFYAYADNLAAAGREEEAIRWFLNAAEADEDEETDAADRAAALAAGEDITEQDESAEELDDLADADTDETADELAADELDDGAAELDDDAVESGEPGDGAAEAGDDAAEAGDVAEAVDEPGGSAAEAGDDAAEAGDVAETADEPGESANVAADATADEPGGPTGEATDGTSEAADTAEPGQQAQDAGPRDAGERPDGV